MSLPSDIVFTHCSIFATYSITCDMTGLLKTEQWLQTIFSKLSILKEVAVCNFRGAGACFSLNVLQTLVVFKVLFS